MWIPLWAFSAFECSLNLNTEKAEDILAQMWGHLYDNALNRFIMSMMIAPIAFNIAHFAIRRPAVKIALFGLSKFMSVLIHIALPMCCLTCQTPGTLLALYDTYLAMIFLAAHTWQITRNAEKTSIAFALGVSVWEDTIVSTKKPPLPYIRVKLPFLAAIGFRWPFLKAIIATIAWMFAFIAFAPYPSVMPGGLFGHIVLLQTLTTAIAASTLVIERFHNPDDIPIVCFLLLSSYPSIAAATMIAFFEDGLLSTKRTIRNID